MQKGFAPIFILIGIVILVAVGGGAYYFEKSQISKPQPQNQTVISQTSQSTSTPNIIPNAISEPTSQVTINTPVPTNSMQAQGADLKNIKYILPQNWAAEIRKDALSAEGLSLAPKTGGGYFWIQVYDYPGTSGRREYYCQVSKVCIEGRSYFTETNIGNISGYTANGIDNSGSGTEYFGAKGNKFYIISTFSPPPPNDFDKNRKNVLDSLIF